MSTFSLLQRSVWPMSFSHFIVWFGLFASTHTLQNTQIHIISVCLLPPRNHHRILKSHLLLVCACIASTLVAGITDSEDPFQSFAKPASQATVCQSGTFNLVKELPDSTTVACAKSCLGLDSCTHVVFTFDTKTCKLYDKFCEDPQPAETDTQLLFVRAVFPTTTSSTSTSTSISLTDSEDPFKTVVKPTPAVDFCQSVFHFQGLDLTWFGCVLILWW